MIISEKQWEDMFISPFIKYNRLVSKGVSSRTALEMVYGKKKANTIYDIISDATKDPKTINEKNN